MDKYYVYEWIRIDINEPFYVGKGKNNRCFDIRRNKYFKDVVLFCEKNNIGIAVHILHNNLSEDEAYELECSYIHEYVFEWGFKLTNQTWGGEGGDVVSMMSEERKKKYSDIMSKSLKGKNTGPRSQEIKLKISETKKKLQSSKGKNNPMYGKNIKDYMSSEDYLQWKSNISKAIKGKKHSEETKLKMRDSALGRKMSEDSKVKLREANIGKNNPMYGKSHSDKSKELIGKVHRKCVVVKYSDGRTESFEAINKCADYLKLEYDISIFTIKKLLKTGEKLNSKYKRLKEFNGMTIYYVDEG